MIRRPPRSTRVRSSAASDVYKRQTMPVPSPASLAGRIHGSAAVKPSQYGRVDESGTVFVRTADGEREVGSYPGASHAAVSYTHLRAHETVLDLVCRLLLEKKKKTI